MHRVSCFSSGSPRTHAQPTSTNSQAHLWIVARPLAESVLHRDYCTSSCRKGRVRTGFVLRASLNVGERQERPNREGCNIEQDTEEGKRLADGAVHVHFLGVGGVGMAPLAVLAISQGWWVSGSDEKRSVRTEWTAAQGAIVAIGHAASNLSLLHASGKQGGPASQLPDLVVASSAVPACNPELQAAVAAGIPVLKREQWLGVATAGQRLAAVSGTHGKTTVSAMLALGLVSCDALEVTALVGGDVPQFPGSQGLLLPHIPAGDCGPVSGHRHPGGGARTGGGAKPPWMVLEADEYDRAFLGTQPDLAIVTNVELEHVDCYDSEEAVIAAFLQFAEGLNPGGVLLACADDPGARRIATANALNPNCSIMTYGLSSCDWVAVPQSNTSPNSFEVRFRGQHMADVSLRLPGSHNVLNALAAIAAASLIDGWSDGRPSRDAAGRAAAAVSSFDGVRRRFERVGTAEIGRLAVTLEIVDDYAHHPTEIRCTLSAAREAWGECAHVMAVFQPHTASRLSSFLHEFAEALSGADSVVVLDVFQARAESAAAIRDGDPANLVSILRQLDAPKPVSRITGDPEVSAASIRDILEAAPLVAPGSEGQGGCREAETVVLVLLGAGDVTKIAPNLLRHLSRDD